MREEARSRGWSLPTERRSRGAIFCTVLFLGLVLQVGTVEAQEIDIIGSLRFSSTESTTIYNLSYGIGTLYTDTTDREYEEFIPPFAPPGGYLVAFDRECSISDGDPPCYFRQDFRGVPDSVASGENNRFSISYRIRVRNATGKGLTIAILNSDWPRGLDSLRVVDGTFAAAFDRTFTGPEVTTIEDPETLWLDVTAYYNLNTLSAPSEPLESTKYGSAIDLLSTIANPVTTQTITLPSGLADPGGIVRLVDVNGRVMRTVDFSQREGGSALLDLQGLPTGAYYLLYVDRNGLLRDRRAFVIAL